MAIDQDTEITVRYIKAQEAEIARLQDALRALLTLFTEGDAIVRRALKQD
jgi:hypothetical protein